MQLEFDTSKNLIPVGENVNTHLYEREVAKPHSREQHSSLSSSGMELVSEAPDLHYSHLM